MAYHEVLSWRDSSQQQRWRVLSRNGVLERLAGSAELSASIAELLGDVQERGDAALLDALERFDRVETDRLQVSAEEIAAADRTISVDLSDAIDLAISRSLEFNGNIVRRASWTETTREGGTVGEIARPIESAGLFVPSGKGSFPSVMVQIGAPAVAAGVSDLCVVVPPLPGGDGRVDPATLVVATRLGIDRIYRLNGPTGIAALTFGTETVPKVRKIVGPGSVPVALAQQLAQSHGVSVVGGLGPTDSLIVADRSANIRLLAADVISEAEHGPDSSAVLVSPYRDVLEKVAEQIHRQLADLPEPRRSYAGASIWDNGGLIQVDDWHMAWEVANAYAPEHIQLAVENPVEMLEQVKFAGTALLGQWTPFSSSNFVIGTPATLPTTGFAKQGSGVTAHTYLNLISTAHIEQAEFWTLADAVTAFTEHEGFPAHGASISVRRRAVADALAWNR